jgi:hypothetical protein
LCRIAGTIQEIENATSLSQLLPFVLNWSKRSPKKRSKRKDATSVEGDNSTNTVAYHSHHGPVIAPDDTSAAAATGLCNLSLALLL